MTNERTDERRTDPRHVGDVDPGAYIGSQPEREAETIPGGVTSQDERVSASAAASS